MSQIALIMPLRDQKCLAMDSIQSLVGSNLGSHFDLIVVQEQGSHNLSLLDFDLEQHNKKTIGRIQFIDVSLKETFGWGRLINHAAKFCPHPVIIPIYPGILFTTRFLLAALHATLIQPAVLNNTLIVAPCFTTGKQNRISAAWPQIAEPGQVAGLTPVVLKKHFTAIRGINESLGVVNQDQDLLCRLIQLLGLGGTAIVQAPLANFIGSELVNAGNVNGIVQSRDLGNRAAPYAVSPAELTANCEEWGEIFDAYETGY
jgi:hypothetical protein